MTRQYGREDVDYDTFYTDFMKHLAKTYTKEELLDKLNKETNTIKKATKTHLVSIEKSTSMRSNSSSRASSRQSVSGHSLNISYISGALEIHDLFPEFAKKS